MITRIIVAYDLNRCIGNGPKLPWHIPQDLKWFKEMTEGHPIIMGRKTWESLQIRPLPNRKNIVLSEDSETLRRINENFSDVETAYSLENALRKCKEQGMDPWIIGGATVYKEALERRLVDEVYATEIAAVHEGDIYFPALPVGNGVGWEVGQVASLIPNARVLHYRRVCPS